jgi:hypothetical protein
VFEIGGGYRLRPLLAVGASFSSFSSGGTAAMTASIPNPLFFDRVATVSVGAADLERTERSLHLRAVLTLPVRDRIDIALSAGPSIIHVSQQVATGTVPAGTQSVTAAFNAETANAFGINLGVDGAYMFTPRLGAGMFVQYTGGSVDLASAKGVKAGGLQTGLGVRVRF